MFQILEITVEVLPQIGGGEITTFW